MNDLVPFASAPPPPLVDVNGRPLRSALSVLTREVSGPTMTGIRSIHSGHPAQGLTPVRLANLLRAAETGDATAYLELAEEMEEKDTHYQSIMGTRKRAVSQLPIDVEAASDSAEHEADAQLVRDWLKRLTLQAELFDILDAIGKGFSITEIQWERTATAWLPELLVRQDPRFFEPDQVTGNQFLLKGGMQSEGEGYVSSGLPQPLAPYKFIQHVHPAKSGIAIRGGLARVAAWGYLFKNYAVKDWVRFLEVYGLPLRVGKYQPGTSEGDIRKLEQAVAQIGSDAGAVIPVSMIIDFVSTGAGASNPDMFQQICTYIDDGLSKAVLGQTSSADAKASGIGSGQADLHGEVRHDIECADAVQLSATLTRDLVRPMVHFNRGWRDAYPIIRIGRPDAVDVKQALESMQAGVALGVPIAVSTFRKMTGLAEPKVGEELLKAPAPATAAQPPQEGEEDAQGRGTPEKSPMALLSLLKTPTGGKQPKGGMAIAAALDDGEQNADPLDAAAEEALGDWEAMMTPVLAPIEQLLEGGGSLEAMRDRLAENIAAMDVSAFAARLGQAGFVAFLHGHAQAEADSSEGARD